MLIVNIVELLVILNDDAGICIALKDESIGVFRVTGGGELELFSFLLDVTDGAANIERNNVLWQRPFAAPCPPLAIASLNGSTILSIITIQEVESSTLNVRVGSSSTTTNKVDILEAVVTDKNKLTARTKFVDFLNAISSEKDDARVLIDKKDRLVNLDASTG